MIGLPDGADPVDEIIYNYELVKYTLMALFFGRFARHGYLLKIAAPSYILKNP
jgi:hypothetical protein